MKPEDFWKDAIYHVDGSEYNVDEIKLDEAFKAYANQGHQGWIDAKIALPEPDTDHEKFIIVVEYFDSFFEKELKRYTDVACFNKKYKCWLTAYDGEIIDDREDCNIVLWQPLPAPPPK